MEKQNKRTAQTGNDRIAGRLALGIIRVQKRWSEVMAGLMGKLSLKGRWVVFIGFILLMLGLNSFLIIGSIRGKKKYFDSKVKITIPVLPPGPVQAGKNALPDEVGKRIKTFRHHLDSLGSTAEGRKARDSILKSRKGLLDSIERIEESFNN
jgi:hypothetical protein